MLIEAQMPCDDQARYVDVLCLSSKSNADEALLPVDDHINESDAHSAVLPVALEADVENEDVDVHSNSSAENILNESAEPQYPDLDQVESGSAVQAVETHDMEIDTDSALRPVECLPIADTNDDNALQASETLDDGADVEDVEENLDIAAFAATTSAHDDWLHRGPYLFDMDFYTFMRFTVRKPRAKDQKVSDVDRAEHCFLFDSHYALAASHSLKDDRNLSSWRR